jgi:predicted RNA-binding protein with PUA-like domain
MNHWLIKTEPGTYSWTDMLRDAKTYWDGVRNFQARNNLRAMRRGDLALFYHSVSEKSIPGVVRIASAPYPDPSAGEGDWTVVDVEPAFALRAPVRLEQIKKEPGLRDMVLLRQSRLSVQPVTKTQFERIVALGGRGPIGRK